MNDNFHTGPPHSAFELAPVYRYFSERSPQAMLAVEGGTSVIRHANSAFLKLSGLDLGSLIGVRFAEAVPEVAANGCGALLDRVYRSGIAESLAEQKHEGTNTAYWSYTAWAILPGPGNQRDDSPEAPGHPEAEGGTPVGVMIQVTDSTEVAVFRNNAMAMNEQLVLTGVRQQEMVEATEKLNSRLEAAVSEKQFFIAVLSHELRTPLTPILAAVTSLAGSDRLDPETREMMDMIHRNVSTEVRLIDDLLDMTRMDRGKLSLTRVPADLRDMITRALESLIADSTVAGLTVAVLPGKEPVVANIDPGRIQQVVSNLLRNAIKFTPPGGKIGIRCWLEGPLCSAEVRDTGVGMEASFLPIAFEAFEQGDKTHARKQGLGLGLAICKTIIELHGGTIAGASDGKGLGSTFTFRLPAAAKGTIAAATTGARIARHKSSDAPAAQARPLRILLVEDHPDTARVMNRLLAGQGHAVEWADSVASGLRAVEVGDFDLLISDMGLPDGTGVELMKILRERGSALPGIALSGFVQDDDIDRSLEAGFKAHLAKPIAFGVLNDVIEQVMGGLD